MANMRGASLLGTLDYARRNFGEEGLRRALDALPPETRQAIGDPKHPAILTQGWYDCRLVSELTRAVDLTCGRGDLALARAAGKHVAFEDVNRFFKWLLRLTSPATISAARPASGTTTTAPAGTWWTRSAAPVRASP